MKYFGNIKWSKLTKNNLGLPRPYFDISNSLRYKNINGEKIFYLHKKVPIPWQSIPVFENGELLNLNIENEEKIYDRNICPYCGLGFMMDETVIRWLAKDKMPEKKGPRVLSDSYPFHIECMKQGRIFCPYMRNTKDGEFETGPYYKLKENAVRYAVEIGILKPPTH